MTKKKIAKTPSLRIPLFDIGIVYFCKNKNSWNQVMTRLGLEELACDGIRGVSRYIEMDGTGERIFIIGVFSGGVGTLAHECAHATFWICEAVGVSVSKDVSNETYCYLLDALVGRFEKEL